MQQTLTSRLPLAESNEKRRSIWQAPFLRNRLAVLSALILLMVAGMALAAPLVATHDPYTQDLRNGFSVLPAWMQDLIRDLPGCDPRDTVPGTSPIHSGVKSSADSSRPEGGRRAN